MAHLAATLLSYLAEGLAPIRPIRIADVGGNPIEAPSYEVLTAVYGGEPSDAARTAFEKGKPGPAMFSAYSQSHLPEECLA